MYAFRCPDCGDFELTRPMGEAPERVGCPRCAASSPRRWTVPLLARTNPALRATHTRAEASCDQLEVVVRRPAVTPA